MTRYGIGNFRFAIAAILVCFFLISSVDPGIAQTTGLPATVTPQLSEPKNMKVYYLKPNRAEVRWIYENNPLVAVYEVYRLENYAPEKTLKLIASLDAKKVPRFGPWSYYDDVSVQKGHTYTFFVTAKDAFGNKGPNSKIVTISVPAPAPQAR